MLCCGTIRTGPISFCQQTSPNVLWIIAARQPGFLHARRSDRATFSGLAGYLVPGPGVDERRNLEWLLPCAILLGIPFDAGRNIAVLADYRKWLWRLTANNEATSLSEAANEANTSFK